MNFQPYSPPINFINENQQHLPFAPLHLDIGLTSAFQLKRERIYAFEAIRQRMPAHVFAPHAGIPVKTMRQEDMGSVSNMAPGRDGFLCVASSTEWHFYSSTPQFQLIVDGSHNYGVYHAFPFHGQALHGIEYHYLDAPTRTKIVEAMSGHKRGTILCEEMDRDIVNSVKCVQFVYMRNLGLPLAAMPMPHPMLTPAPVDADLDVSPFALPDAGVPVLSAPRLAHQQLPAAQLHPPRDDAADQSESDSDSNADTAPASTIVVNVEPSTPQDEVDASARLLYQPFPRQLIEDFDLLIPGEHHRLAMSARRPDVSSAAGSGSGSISQPLAADGEGEVAGEDGQDGESSGSSQAASPPRRSGHPEDRPRRRASGTYVDEGSLAGYHDEEEANGVRPPQMRIIRRNYGARRSVYSSGSLQD